MGATGTPAVDAARRAGIHFTLHEYPHDPRARLGAGGGIGYALEAVAALGIPPERVFKTLVVSVDDRLAVGIVPSSGELDLRRIASVLGGRKAVLADVALAQRATGYVLGGISPLGQKRRLPTVVDASALDHERILVSAGRRGLEIELAPGDLVALTSATVAAISR